LLVSSGPAAVRVPSVVGETRGAAESALENAGFKVGDVTSRATTAQPEGDVVQQTPAGGTTLAAGTRIALVIAKAPNTVRVPDVVGRSEVEAASMLGAAGLEPRTEAVATSEQAKVGVILSQRPSAGKQVRKKSAVTIGVGTLATPTTTTPTTTAPATTPAGAPLG
jgi:serine/threonine-protein kinase